jgi:hypothetical protein
MTEMVTYEGHTGLVALVHAVDDLRKELLNSAMTPEQAAAYLGCINLHLGQVIGVTGEFMTHLEECGGLLCPECRGYVGFVSDLSSCCLHCGERFFPAEGMRTESASEAQARATSVHLAHQGVHVDKGA